MKYKYFFLSVLCFILLFGCQPKTEYPETIHIPKSNILSKKEMIHIMTDIFIAEAYLHKMQQEGMDVKRLTLKYYSQLLDLHSTNEQKIENSVQYYAATGEFELILEQVINNLVEMEIHSNIE
jgi:hypothetical protein